MQYPDLIPHLFRTEFSKITTVLCKHFGLEHMETAEDIAAETFLSALETWPYKGVPQNPAAWLYTVAKNKARNFHHRRKIFTGKIASQIQQAENISSETEIDLSEKNITDSRLQMLFAVCQPAISIESQIGLALRILCGFGIEEIANAFLTNKETIHKRLTRAKEKLRNEKIILELPGKTEIEKRLEAVLRTLYLLFNEGYYSESSDKVLREDLCKEAMQLTQLLLENEQTNRPEGNALMALMCFHASRFAARKNERGEMILYRDQDESLWDQDLIARGAFYFQRSSGGNRFSKYHLEAGIAWWHTIKEDSREKWENILQLYNLLLQIEYSPIAALNRTFALSKVKGQSEAIKEAEKLKLENNHYYFMLLGELYSGIDSLKTRQNFEQAISLAQTQTDKQIIQKRIDRLEQP
jgi:RNA polymerase sigma-70 factor (ECF subfamily)